MCNIGDPVNTGFTLSKVWKKMKSKAQPHANGDPESDEGVEANGDGGHQLTQLVSRQDSKSAATDV